MDSSVIKTELMHGPTQIVTSLLTFTADLDVLMKEGASLRGRRTNKRYLDTNYKRKFGIEEYILAAEGFKLFACLVQ